MRRKKSSVKSLFIFLFFFSTIGQIVPLPPNRPKCLLKRNAIVRFWNLQNFFFSSNVRAFERVVLYLAISNTCIVHLSNKPHSYTFEYRSEFDLNIRSSTFPETRSNGFEFVKDTRTRKNVKMRKSICIILYSSPSFYSLDWNLEKNNQENYRSNQI